MLLDQASSNGPYGCSLCTIAGQQVTKGRGTCRSYAPSTIKDPVSRRSHDMIVLHSEEAVDSPQHGQKGFSVCQAIIR
jgi:hypothetical protein